MPDGAAQPPIRSANWCDFGFGRKARRNQQWEFSPSKCETVAEVLLCLAKDDSRVHGEPLGLHEARVDGRHLD